MVVWLWGLFLATLQGHTQYIPLPLSELVSWIKTPSMYVFDCSAAGIIINALIEVHELYPTFTSSHFLWFVQFFGVLSYFSCIYHNFLQRQEGNSSGASGSSKDCILLAACEAYETLPQSDEFPADVFTACLTTPIKMALHWFVYHLLVDFSLLIFIFINLTSL